LLLKGVKCLKIKETGKVEEDIERVRRIREIAGEKIGLRFYTNQRCTQKEALKFVKATQSVRLELLEQHTLGDQLKMLGKITNGAKIPTDYGR